MNEESRYRIDDKPEKDPFTWGCSVVDEEAGGTIAYFATEDDAKIFIHALMESEKG